VTPRISLAARLRRPSVTGRVGETRVFMNAGTGIKAPTLSQELGSLYGLVSAAVPGVDPIAPEKSRGIDLGVEQAFAEGRVRLRAAYFNNAFEDLIEFVSKSVLTELGVPADAAAATAFGAYVNSQSYDAEGIELSSDLAFGPVTVMASYMYLAAEVTRSFSGGVLAPAENPAFPGIKIGQYAPLVGGRPFRRPANSGSLLVRYNRGPLQVAVSGYLSGVQDDSTYLSDPFFGYSMLLPNKNLGASFQKVDLGAGYAIHPRARWYMSVENLLNQDYQAASGYPALPATLRTGITLSVGGH
jgi:iron complex outermembrane receptor protein/vitamin B12 transporter